MMFYREVNFNDRQPRDIGTYFYIVYSGGHTYGFYEGCLGHMKKHLQDHPDHKIIWLEPESEYDPDTYYYRISRKPST